LKHIGKDMIAIFVAHRGRWRVLTRAAAASDVVSVHRKDGRIKRVQLTEQIIDGVWDFKEVEPDQDPSNGDDMLCEYGDIHP
jgi:hypothetical protein